MNRLLFIYLLLSLLLISGCGKDTEENSLTKDIIIDATGTSIPLLPPPSQIVSLAPSITRNIYLLGAQDKLIGVTDYCKLSEGETKEKVGKLLEPDIEKIIMLNPDLVLATKEGNKPAIIEQLRRVGIKVFVFAESKSFSDVCKNFLNLGTLLHQRGKGEEILNGITQRINIIKQKISHRPRLKVFIELSANPLMTVSKDTFIDEIIRSSGGINIARNALTRYPIYSLEEIISQDPDVIIISSMGEITTEALKAWVRFPNIKAVKNKRVYVIDAETLCEPTPGNFAKAVEEISRMLYSEKKDE